MIVVTGTRGIPNVLGGVETHCEHLYPLLVEKGYDITIIRRKGYILDQNKEYKGVKLVDLNAPHKKTLEAIVHTLKAVHIAKFKLKANIIHIHSIGPALIIPYARLLGLKVVFTHHGFDYDRDKWNKTAKFMLKLGERSAAKYANQLIVISNVINETLKTKYNRSNANLIYNGVANPIFFTDEDYLKTLGIQPQKYFFAMGRFVPEKNFHLLIEAFSSIKDKKDYKLVLAGDADFEDKYSADLKKMADEKGIVLTGFIKGTNLQTLFTNASAYILPSSHEGLPISLLEAMSYNLPVIVSNIPANLEVGLSKENYFDVNDFNQLKEKIELYLETVPEKITYQMDKYDWDKISDQVIEVYKKL